MANKTSKKSAKVASPKKAAAPARQRGRVAAKQVKLLSGGNPQIAKGYGDAPVQAYIAAMPGWKRDVGRRLDALIARTVPGVARPSNGTRPSMASRARLVPRHPLLHEVHQGGFLPRRVAASVPPGTSKQKDVRTSTSTRTTSSTKPSSPTG